MCWAIEPIERPAGALSVHTVSLAEGLSDAKITAVVAQATKRTAAYGARASRAAKDLFAQRGPFDLICCAVAGCFLWVTWGSQSFAKQLALGQVVRSKSVAPAKDLPEDKLAFWAGYPGFADQAGVEAHVATTVLGGVATGREIDLWRAIQEGVAYVLFVTKPA